MEGQDIVHQVSRLRPDQVLALHARARAGDQEAAAALVARGAYLRIKNQGVPAEKIPGILGPILDVITVHLDG